MNYHYIDCMIKERQREELEACERRRMLRSAGYHQETLIRKIGSGIVNAVRRLKEQKVYRFRRLHPSYSMANNVVGTKGGGK